MSKKGIIAMLAVATLTGYTHTLAAQENADAIQRGSSIPEQNIVVPKPLEEASTATTATPEQGYMQPAEKLLSEMKVYPTF